MKLADLFPAPNYLRMPAIGFDIADKSLKYVELKRSRNNIRLGAFDNKPIPAGIIDSGQIKQKEEFINFLKNFRKDIKNKYLIVSLPEEKTFIGNIQLPLMEEKEIRGSLELQLEEHIPLPVKEVIFDYEIWDKNCGSNGDKNHLDISFTAAPSELVNLYRDVLRSAGFTPLVFETEPHALIRALIQPEAKNSQMIIDFGKTRATFIIACGREIGLTSTIKVAGETLDISLSRAFSITPEQGEKLKKEQGLLGSEKDGKATSALLSVVSVIKNEAARHLDYWKAHATDRSETIKEVEKIILCGGDANLIGLPEYLSHELKIPAELGNPWLNIASLEEYIPEIEQNQSLAYATALGLALRSIQK